MMALNEEALSGKEVRLFPASRIKSEREAELRATASLLAVVRAVSEFGKRLMRVTGGLAGRIECYTEVPIQVGAGANSRAERPDGIIIAVHGNKQWAALVEVKVGDACLDEDQVQRYHRLASNLKFDALITVSNQAALPNGLPPGVKIHPMSLRSVRLVHLSWERLLAEAQVLTRHKNVADRDQEWILKEWIRYLIDPDSRIIKPPDLGRHWHKVLRHAKEQSLGTCKRELQDVVRKWDAFLRKTALRLWAKLGSTVKVVMSKIEQKDPSKREERLRDAALKGQQLMGAFRSVQYVVELAAPTEGRVTTRLKWLVKQLSSEDAPDDLTIDVHWGYRRYSRSSITDARKDIKTLLWDTDNRPIPSKAVPRRFYVRRTRALPKAKGLSTAQVLEGIAQGIEDFYRDVVEKIRPFVQKAPKLPPDEAKKPAEAEAHPENARQLPGLPVTEQGVLEPPPAEKVTEAETYRHDDSEEGLRSGLGDS